MKHRVLSTNYTLDHPNRIVRFIHVVMTICSVATLFTAGSTDAIAESGIASVYAYSSRWLVGLSKLPIKRIIGGDQ